MKKVKYKVTGLFGEDAIGNIVDAYLVYQNEGNGLLYHPKSSRWTCGSLEFCQQNHGEDYWTTADKNHDYINIESQRDLNRLINEFSKIRYREKRK